MQQPLGAVLGKEHPQPGGWEPGIRGKFGMSESWDLRVGKEGSRQAVALPQVPAGRPRPEGVCT